jgi:thioredoxin reductase
MNRKPAVGLVMRGGLKPLVVGSKIAAMEAALYDAIAKSDDVLILDGDIIEGAAFSLTEIEAGPLFEQAAGRKKPRKARAQTPAEANRAKRRRKKERR